jgi:hypothetical protein
LPVVLPVIAAEAKQSVAHMWKDRWRLSSLCGLRRKTVAAAPLREGFAFAANNDGWNSMSRKELQWLLSNP